MTANKFYQGKSVAAVEWWLHDCDLPALNWARLRVFADGTADACWAEGTKLFGFDSREYAGNFLAEDEYIRFANWDGEDERDYGVRAADVRVPEWTDRPGQIFEYLGTY
ncbi:MAG: hypothetical protein C0483_24040 [Pirellula sp.]|nr:hypothetical protein [Pirellula sp.]